jgi:hypothetical protein
MAHPGELQGPCNAVAMQATPEAPPMRGSRDDAVPVRVGQPWRPTGGRGPSARGATQLTDGEGSQALLEQLRSAERAANGMDPDGTAYFDVAERIESVRQAYRARLAEEEGEKPTTDTLGKANPGVVAELV